MHPSLFSIIRVSTNANLWPIGLPDFLSEVAMPWRSAEFVTANALRALVLQESQVMRSLHVK